MIISVLNKPIIVSAIEFARVDGLFQSIQNKLRVLFHRCLPADDAIRKGVDDKGHVDKSAPGGHECKIGHPQLV